MERPCIGAARVVNSVQAVLVVARGAYKSKVVDILSGQVLDVLEAKTPFRLCNRVSLAMAGSVKFGFGEDVRMMVMTAKPAEQTWQGQHTVQTAALDDIATTHPCYENDPVVCK